MDKIIEYLIIKSKNNQLLTVNDIDYIIDILLIIYDVKELLNNVNYNVNNNQYVGSYDNNKMELIINYSLIIRLIYEIKNKCNFNEYNNYIFYYNITILYIIMHEIEHILQEKIICHNYDNNYSNLLNLFKYIPDNVKKDNYQICFEERTADIFSIQRINDNISNMSEINSEMKIIINNDYLKKCIRGYTYHNGIYLNPTNEYIRNSKDYIPTFNDDIINNIDNINEKLIYGLEVPDQFLIDLKKDIYQKEKKYFKNRIVIL